MTTTEKAASAMSDAALVKFGATSDGKIAHKQVKLAGRLVNAVEDIIRVAAASAILVTVRTGNCSIITDMCKMVKASEDGGKSKTLIRTNELRKWFVEQGPVYWSTKDASFKMLDIKSSAKYQQLLRDIEENEAEVGATLTANPYWERNPETAFKGFDFPSQLAALIKRAEKTMESDDPDVRNHEKNSFAGLDQARKLAAEVHIPKKKNVDSDGKTLVKIAEPNTIRGVAA